MASKVSKQSVKKVAAKPAASAVRAKRVSAKPVAAKKSPRAKPAVVEVGVTANARKVYLAGLGAVNRAQDEAVKVYNLIANEAERLTVMTSEAAETLARKANVFVREGQKLQTQATSAVEAKARDAAKEVAAFAKKSEKSFKHNVERTIANTVAGAREGVTQLEHVFEVRVAKTLNTFGVPSSKDVRELQARMADLQKALNQLNKRGVRA
jgi:hypothetical protein